ncbi:hypothetical protein [Arsukibacterium sp.]|uniref:hypothetical protein n=1 Tax=Arsukibacterium sp. TaxID=1977258 RepID=UPI002FD8B28D
MACHIAAKCLANALVCHGTVIVRQKAAEKMQNFLRLTLEFFIASPHIPNTQFNTLVKTQNALGDRAHEYSSIT